MNEMATFLTDGQKIKETKESIKSLTTNYFNITGEEMFSDLSLKCHKENNIIFISVLKKNGVLMKMLRIFIDIDISKIYYLNYNFVMASIALMMRNVCGARKMLDFALEANSNIDGFNPMRLNALMIAAFYGKITNNYDKMFSIFKILIMHGVDLYKMNSDDICLTEYMTISGIPSIHIKEVVKAYEDFKKNIKLLVPDHI